MARAFEKFKNALFFLKSDLCKSILKTFNFFILFKNFPFLAFLKHEKNYGNLILTFF